MPVFSSTIACGDASMLSSLLPLLNFPSSRKKMFAVALCARKFFEALVDDGASSLPNLLPTPLRNVFYNLLSVLFSFRSSGKKCDELTLRRDDGSREE